MHNTNECNQLDLSSSPPGPYHQDPTFPKRFMSLTVMCMHWSKMFAFPHQCDPALLPEPNHVMLNHLYSLSIKDGVMVLSATHRYKKKYVTTLMYKPVWPVACGCICLSDQWPVAV
uniref:Protein kinase, AMP-activated, beta 1 non-catalytic subunit, a n=1 Tax=Oncorhynchus kisutch TaxID=8019 RepID=A0A8C7N8J1_ONCKI